MSCNTTRIDVEQAGHGTAKPCKRRRATKAHLPLPSPVTQAKLSLQPLMGGSFAMIAAATMGAPILQSKNRHMVFPAMLKRLGALPSLRTTTGPLFECNGPAHNPCVGIAGPPSPLSFAISGLKEPAIVCRRPWQRRPSVLPEPSRCAISSACGKDHTPRRCTAVRISRRA